MGESYGYFDDSAGEYVITRPDTPKPWTNYLGNSEFGGVLTNNAAGYTFYRSAAQGRLSRFKFNAVPADLNGRYVYLKDCSNGDYWSNSWMPVRKPLDSFEVTCRHGTGYSTMTSKYDGIRSEVSYFTPLGARFEVWKVTVTNEGQGDRHLKLFPFVEPQCNWSAEDDMKNLQYTQYISVVRVNSGILEVGSNVNMPTDEADFTNKDQARASFFALGGAEANGFDGDLTGFLGNYGSYARPRAVERGACGNTECSSDMPAAAFELEVKLSPGESKSFNVLYGVGQAVSEGIAASKAFGTAVQADQALDELKRHWRERLGTLRAETPEPLFDSMLNLWAPFNNLMTFYWSRAASLVYAGERDGLGYRDTLQDIVGASALVRDEARERLCLMLTGQYANGGCKPVVQPFRHRPGEEEPPEHYRSDDGLWLFNAVPALVKETGDLDFYRLSLPFADRGEGTVFEHLRRAIEFNLERCGQHGLPCGLHADWNDCLRLGEAGESVFVAFQLRYALSVYVEIAQLLGQEPEGLWARRELESLDARLDAHAWDGEWYLRAYRHDGLKFGSQESEEGQIFMNAQTWAVISGHAPPERAKAALAAMDEKLATPYGIMLCAPAYVRTDPEVSLARLFNPGSKENAGIFNHTQGWAVLAAAAMGDGERAWRYLWNVLPSRYNEIADVRGVEPYVVCQSTHSSFSPRYGAGRVSWLSGSAVWNYVAMSSAILGIQPDYGGLRIAPCIPPGWDRYRVTRRFRGANYSITIENPGHRSGGVESMTVNGTEIEGNLIPVADAGSEVEVHIVLSGKAKIQ